MTVATLNAAESWREKSRGGPKAAPVRLQRTLVLDYELLLGRVPVSIEPDEIHAVTGAQV